MAALCLLTIHGIGYQQRPDGDQPGYADQLHENLRERLGAALGDDPGRDRGPVYVQSTWPPDSHATEPGISRLGSWDGSQPWSVIAADKPLVKGDAPIAHVALVYSHLEEAAADPTALEDLAIMGAAGFSHYSSLLGGLRLILNDVTAMMASDHAGAGAPPAQSMTVRSDMARPRHLSLIDRIVHGRHSSGNGTPPSAPTGALAGLRQLEDDVAAYMCRNELRERVRSFVREAILRLAFRDDVSGIVVNGHSNGTVIGFDILSSLPGPSARQLRALITAGSPLRKYADLLAWGADAETLGRVQGEWLNFWDPKDPVADPLGPPLSWHRSDPLPAEQPGMFICYDPDSGADIAVKIEDVPVDNIKNSAGGGLRAHNYWDNKEEFCPRVAALLSKLAGVTPSP